ncbi:uroporphyrinogen-III C-methyltransferase [Caulobacter sp. S45]|uniref:uroporphyrinogen-III C-methyltransferase n=1 Tax=Caulobacter sp. S45 TaxID=1641861 RepID=UPI00131BF486|nr:uroporphyrinogen-III C-methyltransferase [Caulobacter sp. S45]
MSHRSRDREAGLVLLRGGPDVGAPARGGKVWLVGAGPGDPELLTLKALRVMQSADVVLHDRLAPQAVLDLAAPGARRLYVGKRKSNHSVPQDELNELLVALAREGLQVVRLKGGDPFMFGRGGEELLACRAAGVACEVIPGVSAAFAAASASGAPLTHRGLAQAVTFVTGHAAMTPGGAPAEPDLDWIALSRPNHTVVVYMGLSTAPVIAARLAEAGRALGTPVLIVERASQPAERRVLTTLGALSEVAATLAGPAVLIIGEVASLAQADGLVAAATTASDIAPVCASQPTKIRS